jgi:hypothetical protein
MKRYQLLLLGVALLSSAWLGAQNFGDALRYSFFEPTGTARFVGAGSALGPMGADFSVISTNPAGLAWMRKSEFMITPGLNINSTTSTLANGSGNLPYDDAAVQFTLPNIGIVTSSRGGRGMETFNFAIGINRLADFNQQFYFEGDSKGSIVQRFEELANDAGLDDFEAGVAFDAEALIEDNGFYFSDFSDFPDAVINRNQTVSRTGGLSEIAFGFAGNVQNKLLWGFSLGIPLLNYDEEKTYRETDTEDAVLFFDDLRYSEQLTATGSGINLKLGLIYRADQALRLSLAVHTPTYFQLDETFSSDMTYNYTFENVGYTGTAESPLGNFNYGLRTPWRFLGGVGTVFGEHGFLSGEVEYVNYTNNRFLFDGFSADEAEINKTTADNLASAVNIRTGAEYVLGSFLLRGGVGLQQAPIVGDDSFYSTFSLGLGVRQKRFFFDFAYRRSGVKSTYTPYQVTNGSQQFVDNNVTKESFVLTAGFRW